MKNGFLILLLLLLLTKVFAQSKVTDSLFVELKDGMAMAIHEVKSDETLYTIAQLYSVPAIILSQKNDVSFYEKLEPKRKLLIPLKYNYFSSNPPQNTKYLYYKLKAEDTYIDLSRQIGINEIDLRALNNGLELAQILQNSIRIGWIQYQSPEIKEEVKFEPISTLANNTTAIVKDTPIEKDTAWGAPSDFENQYKYQTSNGQYIDSLEGMVVFFKPQTAVNDRMLYAFSNDLARGRVLKVVNPSNKRYVFAKVIGRIPSTKQYLNAKIGLDGRAREMLDTREIKLWCTFHLKY